MKYNQLWNYNILCMCVCRRFRWRCSRGIFSSLVYSSCTDLTITERNISNTSLFSFCARVQVQTHTALGVWDLCSLLLSHLVFVAAVLLEEVKGSWWVFSLITGLLHQRGRKKWRRETPLPKTPSSAPSARCRLAASHWPEQRRHISRPCPWLLSPKRRIRRVRHRNTILQ